MQASSPSAHSAFTSHQGSRHDSLQPQHGGADTSKPAHLREELKKLVKSGSKYPVPIGRFERSPSGGFNLRRMLRYHFGWTMESFEKMEVSSVHGLTLPTRSCSVQAYVSRKFGLDEYEDFWPMRIGPGQRGFSELDLDLPNVAAAPSAAVNADRDTSTIFMNVVCGKLSSTSRSSRSGTCSLSLPVKRTATHSRYVAPAISGTMNEFSTYAMDPAFLKAGNPSSPTACPTEQLLATETVRVRIPVCSQLKDLRKVRTSSLDQIPTFYDPDAERTLDLRRLRQQQQYLDMTLRQLLELLDSYDHNVRVPVPTDLGSLDLPPNNSLYLQIQAGAEKVTQNLLRVGDSIDRLAAIYTPYTPFCLPLDLTSSWMGFDLSSLYPDVQPISFPMPPSDAPSHASMWNLEQILGTNPCIDPALLNGGEELRPESQEAQTAPVVTAHLLVEAPNAAPPGAQHAIEPPFVERERKSLNGYIRNEML
ncbi:hypothetical protein C8R46DRAFT_1042135 [Mycena filopes]|nr:hypothetical protein C8R46DRAFT_1042135 [Mycena filopes]